MHLSSSESNSDAAVTPAAQIQWTEAGVSRQGVWRSERGAGPPRRIVLADDTLDADRAYRLACEGVGLLWRGDFHNAKLLLQALARRIDKTSRTPRKNKSRRDAAVSGLLPTGSGDSAAAELPAGTAFHLYRQAQAQRARVLGMVLIEFAPDYSITLRRAPDARLACREAWGESLCASEAAGSQVASLRELLGVISAHEWRKTGVEISALGQPPNNRIFPHYGVFSPVRGEYIDLVATAPLLATRADRLVAFDIGTGSGVLAAVLATRGVDEVVATDTDLRALACAQDNLSRLVPNVPVKLLQADLFPPGQASLIVCNPPWLPARPGSSLEAAVYDEGGRMLAGFLHGLAEHLAPGGEGWLVLSDLAEHLGLRTREALLAAIAAGGLRVVGRADTKPRHPRATDVHDALHAARAQEITSLWRLAAA